MEYKWNTRNIGVRGIFTGLSCVKFMEGWSDARVSLPSDLPGNTFIGFSLSLSDVSLFVIKS